MKADIQLLDRVIGEKKERDLAVLQMIAEGYTGDEIGFLFKLVKSRISQIHKANKQLCDELTLTAELATKAGRLRKAFRVLRRKGDHTLSDSLDWIKFVRTEIEGEKGIDVKVGVGVSVHGNGNGKFVGEDERFSETMRDYLRHAIDGNGKHNGNTE
jgi:hypothetical protein